MQRKVDAMNGRVPPPAPKSGEKPIATTTMKSWWGSKDLEQKRWFLYVWLMIIAITVVYAVPHFFDGEYTAKRFYIGGIVVLLGLHFVIWPLYTEKTSKSTKIVATAVFLFLVAAVLAPNAAVRAMNTADKVVEEFDKNAFATSAADSSGSQKQAKGRWMKFDSDVYELANPNDPEGIIVDNPEEWIPLPRIPTGYRFNVYCDEAAIKIYWKGGPQYGQELKCGEKFGENLEDLLITVSPNTDDPATISVWLEPIH